VLRQDLRRTFRHHPENLNSGQFSEQLAPEPDTGGRFRNFAVAPQISWNFCDPFFVAGIFNIILRSAGRGKLSWGAKASAGFAIGIAEGVKLTGALIVPYTFYPEHAVGITPLIGVSLRL
jgi:hypothetical protein